MAKSLRQGIIHWDVSIIITESERLKSLRNYRGQFWAVLSTWQTERDMAQWLERGALPMSLPAVRFRILLGAGISEKSCFSPLNLRTLLRCCVLGQGASLDSGEKKYLVGQRWQCVRWVQCAETAAGLYALRGVEMAHEWSGPVTRG